MGSIDHGEAVPVYDDEKKIGEAVQDVSYDDEGPIEFEEKKDLRFGHCQLC